MKVETGNKSISDGIERLRSRWPQAHAVPAGDSKYGPYLVTVPTVKLPKGFDCDVCTVLFVAPAGFPAVCPMHFYTDLEVSYLRSRGFSSRPQGTFIWTEPKKQWLSDRAWPNGGFEWTSGGSVFSPWCKYWPQWDHAMLWLCKLQMWNPNQSGLFTYMKVVEMGLRYYAQREARCFDSEEF